MILPVVGFFVGYIRGFIRDEPVNMVRVLHKKLATLPPCIAFHLLSNYQAIHETEELYVHILVSIVYIEYNDKYTYKHTYIILYRWETLSIGITKISQILKNTIWGTEISPTYNGLSTRTTNQVPPKWATKKKKNSYFPLYSLVDRNPYNGLL